LRRLRRRAARAAVATLLPAAAMAFAAAHDFDWPRMRRAAEDFKDGLVGRAAGARRGRRALRFDDPSEEWDAAPAGGGGGGKAGASRT
jgi:hypothetical protein